MERSLEQKYPNSTYYSLQKNQKRIYNQIINSYSNSNNLNTLQKSIADSYSRSNAHQTLKKSFNIKFLEGKVILSNK